MRGHKKQQETLFSLRTLVDRVPKDHPLRRVKDMADAALAALSPTFEKMYSKMGRPSIPPEQLLKASLLMAFYTVHSERLFCEQLDYNLLFRWFLDMGMEDASFDHSTFSQNRERLLEHDVARQFYFAVMAQAQSAGLTSNEHFTVDGSLIDAWASVKSFRPKDEEESDRHHHRGTAVIQPRISTARSAAMRRMSRRLTQRQNWLGRARVKRRD